MSDEPFGLNEDDIADLNRATIARSAAFLRIGGTVIFAIGVVGAVAWAWYEIRLQQNFSGSPLSFNASSGSVNAPDLGDRIDVLAGSMSLLTLAAIAAGLGLAARHLTDYTQARTGQSLTGYLVGDIITHGDEEDESSNV